jgi:hypothetical protein
MLYRPAGFATLPSGVSWRFVEAPQGEHWRPFIDMPVSRHRYGVIETDRELTADELATFQIEEVK